MGSDRQLLHASKCAQQLALRLDQERCCATATGSHPENYTITTAGMRSDTTRDLLLHQLQHYTSRKLQAATVDQVLAEFLHSCAVRASLQALEPPHAATETAEGFRPTFHIEQTPHHGAAALDSCSKRQRSVSPSAALFSASGSSDCDVSTAWPAFAGRILVHTPVDQRSSVSAAAPAQVRGNPVTAAESSSTCSHHIV